MEFEFVFCLGYARAIYEKKTCFACGELSSIFLNTWFRGGVAFKAHRLVYYSTLGFILIKKKKNKIPGGIRATCDHKTKQNRSAVAHVLLLDASKGSNDADVTLASGRVDLREMADMAGDCTVATLLPVFIG